MARMAGKKQRVKRQSGVLLGVRLGRWRVIAALGAISRSALITSGLLMSQHG
jgi:hypothetical protein